jgi:hypothetical protein
MIEVVSALDVSTALSICVRPTSYIYPRQLTTCRVHSPEKCRHFRIVAAQALTIAGRFQSLDENFKTPGLHTRYFSLHDSRVTFHNLHFTLHSLHTLSHIKLCELNDLLWTSGGPNIQQTTKIRPDERSTTGEGNDFSHRAMVRGRAPFKHLMMVWTLLPQDIKCFVTTRLYGSDHHFPVAIRTQIFALVAVQLSLRLI